MNARAAVLQMNSGNDLAANLRAAGDLLKQAADAGAALAALPENFAFMGAKDTDKLAHAEDEGGGPIQDFLSARARELKLWIVAGTLPLRAGRADRVYAASVVFDANGAAVGRYDKVHLFDVDVPNEAPSASAGGELSSSMTPAGEKYRESASIEAGLPRAVVVDTPVGRVGLTVCYDLRFPELYRALAAAGAEVLSVPAAFTARTGAAHWDVLLRARAVENQCYVLAPGECGTHPGGRQTWGHSMIVEPWGEVIGRVESGTGIAVAELSASKLKSLRQSFPALKHRRMQA